MKKSNEAVLWVVYRMTLRNSSDPVNVICEQSEWDALERRQPGLHTLIRDRIANENEAELLARGTSGDPVKRTSKPRQAAAVRVPETAS